MKQRIPALFLCVFYILTLFMMTACSDDRGSGAGYLFSYTLVGNPKSLDPQLAEDISSKTVIGNLFAGLYRLDKTGNVTPDVASDCTVSSDGRIYTITLRQNSYWRARNDDEDAEPIAVTAHDFVFAFRRMFNPEIRSPYGAQFSCLEHAEEILSGTASYETLGVRAVSDYEIEFTLAYPNANFLSLLATTAAMPCSSAFFDSTKGRYGLDEDSVCSNGAFYLTKWFYDAYGKDNVIYLKRSSENSKHETVYPSNLVFYIAKDEAEAAANFSAEKTDCLVTTNASYSADSAYSVTAAPSQTLGLIFSPDSVYGQNAALREALSLGLKRSDYQSELTEDVQSACAPVPPAVSLLGKGYRELVAENSFKTEDEVAAKEAYQQALESLGTSSVDSAQILVPAGLTDYTVLHTITRRWSLLFGISVGIEEVTAAEYASRLESGNYIIALYALSADQCSVPAVLNEFLQNPELALSDSSSAELAALLDETRSLENLNGSIELYRKAEQIILADHSFLPLFYKNVYLVTRPQNEDIRLEPFSGQVYFQNAKFFEE